MSLAVLVAVEHHLEGRLVSTIEAAVGLSIARRCADSAELLSAAAAGLADVALVSAGFRGIERESLRALAGHGVRPAGLVVPGDEAAERRLRQLGVNILVSSDCQPAALADLLTAPTGPHGMPGDPTIAAEAAPAAADAAAPAWHATEPARTNDDVADPEELHESTRTARVTAVWGPTGAPGRSTLATTVATLLAGRGVSTLLIDLDTYGASIAQLLGLIDEAPGLAAAARAAEQGTLDVAGLARLAPMVTPGLRVLTGLPSAQRWPEVRTGTVEHITELSRRLVDHVVLDVGFSLEADEELTYDTRAPQRNAATLAALQASDGILAVGAADPIGLSRLVRGMSELAEQAVPVTAVVVNKVRASVAGAHPQRSISELLARFAGLTDLHFVPWAPQECDAALLAGRAVAELRPDGELALAVGALLPALHDDLPGARRGGRRARRITRRS